jgi:transposase
MTIAEMLENKGRQAVAVELLREGLSIEFTAKVTKLSEETIKALTDDLDRNDSPS